MQTFRRGFTRAELITTAVVLAILAGLLIPWIAQKRVSSKRTFCESRQIAVSKALFLRGLESPSFPGFREIQAKLPDQRTVETSWVFPVLPYIHPLGTEIAEEIRRTKAEELLGIDNDQQLRAGPYRSLFDDFGSKGNLAGKPVPKYIVELVCPESGKAPSAEIPQPMSFVVNSGMPDKSVPGMPLDHLSNGVFFDSAHSKQMMSIDFLTNHDGLENTIMLSENLDAGQAFDTQENKVGFVWINSRIEGIADRDPQQLLGVNQLAEGIGGYATARPSSFHPGGINVAFADCSTMFLSEKIDYLVYVHYMTSDGFEVKIAGSNDYEKDPYRLSR